MSTTDWELLAAILGGMGIAAAGILVVYVFYCILIPYAGRGIFWIRDWVELRHWRARVRSDIHRLHLDSPPTYDVLPHDFIYQSVEDEDDGSGNRGTLLAELRTTTQESTTSGTAWPYTGVRQRPYDSHP